ncbi:hypothetical protein, partial [Pantanalinema sp. GBBB05]|uniref:hypothetical protein n=1 Tax=Pantanalinema sp. GBBB05 TaxID=2604139 RepID=UPI003D81342D
GIYWANRQHRQRFTPLRDGHEYDLASPAQGAAVESTLPYGLPERLSKYDQINAESKFPHPPH